jgi:hypothetical protein
METNTKIEEKISEKVEEAEPEIPPKRLKQAAVKQQHEMDQQTQVVDEKESQLEIKYLELKKITEAMEAFKTELEHLRLELSKKSNLKSELLESESQLKSATYELNRTKAQKEEVMKHYEKTIKNLSERLALEERDHKSIREFMLKFTPDKSNSFLNQEIKNLKKENLRKSKELAAFKAELLSRSKQGQK